MPSCSTVKSLQLSSTELTTDSGKVVLLSYNLKEDAFTLKDAFVLYNDPPNYFLEHGMYELKGISAAGEELFTIAHGDPREFHLGEQQDFEPGMMMGKDVDFSVVVPYRSGLRMIEIREAQTGETVHTADLADAIIAFCQWVEYKDYKDTDCQTSDLDNDGIPDMYDNCPKMNNPS